MTECSSWPPRPPPPASNFLNLFALPVIIIWPACQLRAGSRRVAIILSYLPCARRPGAPKLFNRKNKTAGRTLRVDARRSAWSSVIGSCLDTRSPRFRALGVPGPDSDGTLLPAYSEDGPVLSPSSSGYRARREMTQYAPCVHWKSECYQRVKRNKNSSNCLFVSCCKLWWKRICSYSTIKRFLESLIIIRPGIREGLGGRACGVHDNLGLTSVKKICTQHMQLSNFSTKSIFFYNINTLSWISL